MLPTSSFAPPSQLIQGDIELEHVHSIRSQKAELQAFDMLIDKRLHIGFRQPPGFSHARYLEQGALRANVWIKAASRGQD